MLFRTLLRTPIRGSTFHNIFNRSIASSHYSDQNPIPRSKHNDLPSFKAYAEASGLDPESSLYVGTVYEYVVSEALYSKNMTLNRCGGRSDKGIDLRGLWHIPLPPSLVPNSGATELESTETAVYRPPSPDSFDSPKSSQPGTPTKVLPVLVQCKRNAASPLKVNLVRELVGTLAYCQSNTIGLLASIYPCTNGARDALRFIKKPMGYVCISEEGVVQQFVWNRMASELIGSGLSVGIKYVTPPKENANITMEGLAQEAVLMYDGKVVDGLLFQPVEVIKPEKKKKSKKAEKEQALKERKEKKEKKEKTGNTKEIYKKAKEAKEAKKKAKQLEAKQQLEAEINTQ